MLGVSNSRFLRSTSGKNVTPRIGCVKLGRTKSEGPKKLVFAGLKDIETEFTGDPSATSGKVFQGYFETPSLTRTSRTKMAGKFEVVKTSGYKRLTQSLAS